MKILKYLLIISALLIFTNIVHAQEINRYLTIIEYKTSQEQTLLINNNEKIFEYLENSLPGTNVMLTIMNEHQKELLLSKGFKIQIIEENPDMKKYILLYHRLENQGSKLAYLGKVFLVTNNHTLVKLNEGTTFDHTGGSAQFFMIPMQDIIPAVKEFPNTTPVTSPPIQKYCPPFSLTCNSTLVRILAAILFIIIVIVGFWYYKKKKKQVS